MNKKANKTEKRKIDKKKLALRIACGALAALMILGAAYTLIAVLLV